MRKRQDGSYTHKRAVICPVAKDNPPRIYWRVNGEEFKTLKQATYEIEKPKGDAE